MSVIFKYPVTIGSVVSVRNGDVVHFGEDGTGMICAWIRHYDNDNSLTNLYIVGTGAPINDDHIVHGSFADKYGYVWHLVEEWNAE